MPALDRDSLILGLALGALLMGALATVAIHFVFCKEMK